MHKCKVRHFQPLARALHNVQKNASATCKDQFLIQKASLSLGCLFGTYMVVVFVAGCV